MQIQKIFDGNDTLFLAGANHYNDLPHYFDIKFISNITKSFNKIYKKKYTTQQEILNHNIQKKQPEIECLHYQADSINSIKNDIKYCIEKKQNEQNELNTNNNNEDKCDDYNGEDNKYSNNVRKNSIYHNDILHSTYNNTIKHPNTISEIIPEICFIGRSNVGKSSLINTLVNRTKLVRVSQNPGCTKQINFFSVKKMFILVDLPGYGHASASKNEKERWRKLVFDYFVYRNKKQLVLTFLLLDGRRELTKNDCDTIDFFIRYDINFHVVITKMDKSKKSDIHLLKRQINNLMGLGVDDDKINYDDIVSNNDTIGYSDNSLIDNGLIDNCLNHHDYLKFQIISTSTKMYDTKLSLPFKSQQKLHKESPLNLNNINNKKHCDVNGNVSKMGINQIRNSIIHKILAQ